MLSILSCVCWQSICLFWRRRRQRWVPELKALGEGCGSPKRGSGCGAHSTDYQSHWWWFSDYYYVQDSSLPRYRVRRWLSEMPSLPDLLWGARWQPGSCTSISQDLFLSPKESLLWRSMCNLWRNVCLGLLPIFGLGCLFFWYWAAWAACIFWRLILLQIYSPILMVVFLSCLWFPFLCKKKTAFKVH